MTRTNLTRRELAALLAVAASAATGKAAAQPTIELDPSLANPLPEGTTARIWPGGAVDFSSADNWSEFFVENTTPGGFHEKAFSESVEPTFIEAGADLTAPPNDIDMLMKSYFEGDQTQHNRTIEQAKGGEVLNAYQRMLEATKMGLMDVRHHAITELEMKLQSSSSIEDRPTFYENTQSFFK